MRSMNLNLEVEQEEDGRWLAEVLELPGAMAYGASADEAMVKAEALAFRALAKPLEHGEIRWGRQATKHWPAGASDQQGGNTPSGQTGR